MSKNDQEIEVKFYVLDLPAVERRLKELGATCVQPRAHEFNLRFDTSAGDLRAAHQVLRLRRNRNALLTFKGPSHEIGGILTRQEIEVAVGSFDAARHFLEALGFEVIFIYEKYRTVYDLAGTHVMLDELPYGDFVEIEGEDRRIRASARKLHLSWENAIPASYHELLEKVTKALEATFRDLTFRNFENYTVNPGDLEVLPAD